VFPHLSSIDIPFSSYPLKAKYVELMGKNKGYNSSYAYCQVKGWSKKSYETFSNNFENGFKNSMMEGEKMDSRKKILKLRWFFLLSKYWLPHFICGDSWSFSFSFIFFSILSLSLSLSRFSMLHLFEDLKILMINEEKNTLQKFLFRWNGIEWLSHDYENGEVVDISAVDAYSGMELCMPILLGEASKNFWMANHFRKIWKLTMDTSLNKAQHKQELLCW
jgi:hypothetical protein